MWSTPPPTAQWGEQSGRPRNLGKPQIRPLMGSFRNGLENKLSGYSDSPAAEVKLIGGWDSLPEAGGSLRPWGGGISVALCSTRIHSRRVHAVPAQGSDELSHPISTSVPVPRISRQVLLTRWFW